MGWRTCVTEAVRTGRLTRWKSTQADSHSRPHQSSKRRAVPGRSASVDGFSELSVVFQSIAEIVVGFDVFGSKGDGPTDQTHRIVIPSHLLGNYSKIVHRIGMLRLLGEDLPVKLLGLW
jgi:hypothetical protein